MTQIACLIDRIKKNQAAGRKTKITRIFTVGDFNINHYATGYNEKNDTVSVEWSNGHDLEFKASYIKKLFKEA